MRRRPHRSQAVALHTVLMVLAVGFISCMGWAFLAPLSPMRGSPRRQHHTRFQVGQEIHPVPAPQQAMDISKVPEGKQPLHPVLFHFNCFVIDSVKGLIDVVYSGRDFQRFFVLETVARVPYFAYLSVLHLRETFGLRDSEMTQKMRMHYAEADNELHHLLIMESQGGGDDLLDRTFAQSLAFVYYWYVVAIYSLSPQSAYHLSELIEDHAYNTYDNFLRTKEKELKHLPVPDVARKYYVDDNPWLRNICYSSEEYGSSCPNPPRYCTKLESMFDVIRNVRDDEKAHWETLCSLVQYDCLSQPQGSQFRASSPDEISLATGAVA